jgi:hypothetical protein
MAYGIMLNRPPPAVYRFTGEKGAVMVSEGGVRVMNGVH